MQLENHCTYELDNLLLSIENLKYLPWIGKQALNTRESKLIIGESVYNWEKEAEKRKIAQIKLEKNDFASSYCL